MHHIGDRIVPPQEITEPSVREAIASNTDLLLRNNMSRFAYARAAVSSASPHDLPALHLMDHRLRLPRLDLGGTQSAKAADIDAKIVERLERMLVMSSHPGARKLSGNALGLDPKYDASLLRQAYEVSPRFFNSVLSGRLGSALSLIPHIRWVGMGESGATWVVRQALLYHSAFQTQLIAARGRSIDRHILRLIPGPKAYTEAECCTHLWETLCAIEKIIEKLSGETSQPPQRTIVADRRSKAEAHRAAMDFSDDEIVQQAVVFFSKRREMLTALRKKLGEIKETATVESLHKAIFGLTSVETLLFSAMRLVQVKTLSEDLLSRRPDNLKKLIPITSSVLPTIDDRSVAKLVYVYRAVILRDDSAPDIVGNDGADIDLDAAWRTNASGNLPAANTAKKRRRFLDSQACKRQRLTSFPVSRLEDGQRIDVLPEYLLQRFAKKRQVRPGAQLLAQVRRKRELEQAQRPPNIWKAPKRSPKA